MLNKNVIILLICVYALNFAFAHEKICLDQHLKVHQLNKHEQQVNEDYIACAYSYDSEGWHIFNVEASIQSNTDNALRSYAAGFLEGWIYHKYINYHYTNIYKSIMRNIPLTEKTNQFVYGQFNYTHSLASKSNLLNDPLLLNFLEGAPIEEKEYYETLSLILDQYRGLYEGYKSAQSASDPSNVISEQDFYLITMQADLEDIIIALENERVENHLFRKEKDCTGFVKFVKETNNLIVAHNTHNLYTLMNRIYKHYNLNITLSTGKKLNDFKYSSRPGDLNSKDDYYVLSNKMVVLETSLAVLNQDLYKNLKMETVPKWIRVNIANKLADNNREWVEYFFKHNSGTHNNQWLIVDYKEFNNFITSGRAENIIHIVEQTPLLDKKYFEDVSEILIEQTYFASYNAPYFREVIDTIGCYFDYWNARRHFLFKELHKDANDIESTKKIIRFHSKEDLCDTIAPRCDLVDKRPFGTVDGKVTDINFISEMNSHIIYGPPHIKGVTEPFNFTLFDDSHLGIPDYFGFEWIIA